MKRIFYGLISLVTGVGAVVNLAILILSTYFTGSVISGFHISFILQIISIIFGIIGIVKDDSRVFGIMGVIIGVNSLMFCIFFIPIWVLILAPLWTGMG